MENIIGFKGNSERIIENYEATVAGFCDCLYDALCNLSPKQGNKYLKKLQENIYGEIDEIINGDL